MKYCLGVVLLMTASSAAWSEDARVTGPARVEHGGWIYTYARAPFPRFEPGSAFDWCREVCRARVARENTRRDLTETAIQMCLDGMGWRAIGKVFK
jgi:hypothetical protein